MRTSHTVWLDSHPNPFVISPRFCTTADCDCDIVTLELTEVSLEGEPPSPPLRTRVQVSLGSWLEYDPPQRSRYLNAIIQELLLDYPEEWKREHAESQQNARAESCRLQSLRFTSEPGTLVCYSDVRYETGGFIKGGGHYSFQFSHAGRVFLIEDYYCPTPDCDCRRVHFEFWERRFNHATQQFDLSQQIMAAFTLEGQFLRTEFNREDKQTTAELMKAWQERVLGMRDELETRYQQVKVIGERSFPPRKSAPPSGVNMRAPLDVVRRQVMPTTTFWHEPRTGRNDPCPCGSGKKFKRCCGMPARS